MHSFGVVIVGFEQISHIVLVPLLLTLKNFYTLFWVFIVGFKNISHIVLVPL